LDQKDPYDLSVSDYFLINITVIIQLLEFYSPPTGTPSGAII